MIYLDFSIIVNLIVIGTMSLLTHVQCDNYLIIDNDVFLTIICSVMIGRFFTPVATHGHVC